MQSLATESSSVCTVAEIMPELRIAHADGQITAAECLSSVPVLRAGDRVLVHLGSTPAVIIGRIGGMPEELVFEAGKNLTIRCGTGSIRLRADGRVLIEGLDIVSRARRAQRITGSQVVIN